MRVVRVGGVGVGCGGVTYGRAGREARLRGRMLKKVGDASGESGVWGGRPSTSQAQGGLGVWWWWWMVCRLMCV